ncbi:Major myo-inositol transporter IolT [Mycobacterium innocens]|uniref:Major myo-inositol transporter IolT n=1 Tax=Mycobacterium innocens TaxID=2341083 RepID=A0A498PZU0_9MYCO|nr:MULTISPECIES: MFS transporter [Mycobacterium]VBA39348.1 Major myo-inositol transporter IolT [Mycobacterium innocens]
MSASAQTGTITTQVPARLDRLPWGRFHWRVVIGLGGVWILDGLEVTMVGNVSSRLTEHGSGIELNAADIGLAASFYIAGACLGALFFGHLTDRFGRRNLFLLTLAVYLIATVATAFAFAPWYFFLTRFFTGSGIGGEYAAINSAIDELIPARVRGRVDLVINGTYWLGSAAGAAGALVVLDTSNFPPNIGWRLAFGVGAIFGIFVLLVRRNVPESPRWLFIHGREHEAERIVGEIEGEVERDTGQPLPEPQGRPLKVRQRHTISFWEIARVAFTLYPRRAVLGLALFIGQAFLYNGVTFNLGTLLSGFYGVASGHVPVFFIVWALSNFVGPLVLGRLFDTIGRKPMITFSYIGSAVVAVVLAALFVTGTGGVWTFIIVLAVAFFLASAGASAAYLTVSEIFPMETRALAIAFFYATGTAIGGISGPLLFGQLINSGQRSQVFWSFLIGAVVMAAAGLVELWLGVAAERRPLEELALPLTVADADQDDEPTAARDGQRAGTALAHDDDPRGGHAERP